MGEEEFNKFLVREYFKYGSVEEALRRNNYNIPVSYANYQKILNKCGVIKAAGPNNKLTEAILFCEHFVRDNINVDGLYKKMPLSFQTSAKTLYRIVSYMKEGITRRVGTALVISPFDEPKKILVAADISIPRIELGKAYGSFSLPMGYSRKRDGRKINIERILQNEVFTSMVIEGNFPDRLVPDRIEPFMYLDIADVRVSAYSIILPKELSDPKRLFSYKLNRFRYLNMKDLLMGRFKDELRAGVLDIVKGYDRYLKLVGRNLVINPLQEQSFLNKELARLTIEVDG
jgi:hypothetical protein